MHAIILEEHKQIKLKPKLIYKVMLHPTQLKLTHSSMKSMAIEIYAHVHPMLYFMLLTESYSPTFYLPYSVFRP